MSEKIDWSKPIETTDGRSARVLCTDLRYRVPCVVAIDSGPVEHLMYVTESGEVPGLATRIRNVPEKHTRWMRWYRHNRHNRCDDLDVTRYKSEEAARLDAAQRPGTTIAVFPIEFEEGQGLE